MNLNDKYAKYSNEYKTTSAGTIRIQATTHKQASIDLEPVLVTVLIITIIITVILYAGGM